MREPRVSPTDAEHAPAPSAAQNGRAARSLACPQCGGALVLIAAQANGDPSESLHTCRDCGRRFGVRIREKPATSEHKSRGPEIDTCRPTESVGELNLSARLLALRLQRWLYAPATACGAAMVFSLGGFVAVIGRWLRNEIMLTGPVSLLESLGGVWVRKPTTDPDADLGPAPARGEAAVLLDEVALVARRFRLRRVPEVRLTYLPCCGVVACGRRQRALVVGLPLLAVLNRAELRAVLAHELAHWGRGDAVGTLRMQQFVTQLGEALELTQPGRRTILGRWAGFNLAIARRLMAPVVHGQELRADRAAASIAGGAAAASALMKVAIVQPVFREVLIHYQGDAPAASNLFAFFREFWRRMPEEMITGLRHDLLSTPSNDPTHPGLLDRLALAQSQADRPFAGASAEATSVLGDLEYWERRLHEHLLGSAPVEPSVFHQAGT